jgi:hypothetical protein
MGGSEQGIEEKRFWRVRRLLSRRWRRRAAGRGRILPRQLAWVRGGFIIAWRAGQRRVRDSRAGGRLERSPPPTGGERKGYRGNKHDGGEVWEGTSHEQAPEGAPL